MTDYVKLVQRRGPTSILIEAEINGKGDLVFSGQDIGKAPSEFFGDSDYEYWLTIRAEHKDAMLLALIEKHYAGKPCLISMIKECLESKNIPCVFNSYS